MTCQQDADLVVRQHPIGMDLWPVFDLEGLPGGCLMLELIILPISY